MKRIIKYTLPLLSILFIFILLFSCDKETKYNTLECNILNDEDFSSVYFDANTKITIKGVDKPYYADIQLIAIQENDVERILYASYIYNYLVNAKSFDFITTGRGRLYAEIGSNFDLVNDRNSYYISKPNVSVTPIDGEIKVLVDSNEDLNLSSATNGVNISNGLIKKGIRFVLFNCCKDIDLSNIYLSKTLIIDKLELKDSGTCDIDFKDIQVSQEINSFNSNSKKTIYTFISPCTQIYNIEIDEGYTVKVFDNDSNIIDIKKEKLKYNNNYYIIVYSSKTGTYNIKIDYPIVNGEIELLYGDVMYLRFNAPDKNVYYIGNNGDNDIEYGFTNTDYETFGFVDVHNLSDIKSLDKNETTLIKIYNNTNGKKKFVPNIVEVSKSNVYNSYAVSSEGDYLINTNDYYYIYDGDNLEISNDKTSFFEDNIIIYSKCDFSMELMEYTFYALVNGNHIKNHGTCNELYYGDTLENVELYVKYNDGSEEKVNYGIYVNDKKIEASDAIYENMELSLRPYNIEINSNDPIIYIVPKPISFSYSISGDNVCINANNYNGKINEVVFEVENDYGANGTLIPHIKTLDESKSALFDRCELIGWAKGYGIKLNIYLLINDDYISLDDMLYNSSLEFDLNA